MTYANDIDETHSLSCRFCNKDFNARGKMPMEIICPLCSTLLNVRSPWNIRRGARIKHKQDGRGT
jgi:phage FluMu protein Com